jgi:hypothetical protein
VSDVLLGIISAPFTYTDKRLRHHHIRLSTSLPLAPDLLFSILVSPIQSCRSSYSGNQSLASVSLVENSHSIHDPQKDPVVIYTRVEGIHGVCVYSDDPRTKKDILVKSMKKARDMYMSGTLCVDWEYV